MKTPGRRQKDADAQMPDLVWTALSQESLSGFSEMLRVIAESVHADGCVLREIAPGADLQCDPPKGNFYTLAHWSRKGEILASHDLKLDSATGEAVVTGKPVNPVRLDDNWNHPRVNPGPFFRSTGIRSFCSVPLRFLDGALGAVSVYRRDPSAFSREEVTLVQQLTSWVPGLFRIIRDRVSFTLIHKVNEKLHEAERRAEEHPLPKHEMGEVVQKICEDIAETFQCMETGVFLEDRLEKPGSYDLVACVWVWPETFKKTSYRKNEPGLTGWVLGHEKAVRIFDLSHFERDLAEIRLDYPGIIWTDSLNIASAAREFWQLDPGKELPPLSFMATPILKGGDVLGLIRCCARKKGPYFFEQRDLSLLELVGARIGLWWNNWLAHREREAENVSWRELVGSVSELNTFVYSQLNQATLDEHRIFEAALRVTRSVVPGADIMDVRLLDEKRHELYFFHTSGPQWTEVQRQRRFPVLEKPPRSLGAYVHQERKVCLIPDVGQDPYYSVTFPETKRMVIAPISVAEDFFGVLDIRGTGDEPFPRHVEDIAKLLGRQLGLYCHLASTMRKLRDAQIRLKGDLERQTHTIEDLEHQVMSPIIMALARTQAALRGQKIDPAVESQLLAVRGLCAKAKRVAMAAGLFADLAREKPLRLQRQRLEHDYVRKILIEAAVDSRLLMDPYRSIRFKLDEEGLESLHSIRVMVDRNLLEQAVNNLLDNAGRYSYPGTTVRIYGGLTARERFHISVVNKGLRVRAQEVDQLIVREWRGAEAQLTTGEGSGIGLWIVWHIMKAHDGELLIVPTNAEGLTEVKLIFPRER